jgi:hypothetical protein
MLPHPAVFVDMGSHKLPPPPRTCLEPQSSWSQPSK